MDNILKALTPREPEDIPEIRAMLVGHPLLGDPDILRLRVVADVMAENDITAQRDESSVADMGSRDALVASLGAA